ncbi:hypothetical protein Pmani_004420 [Petrolisthes manimaculis]|uniref:Uncharacterized protein n=1 Tax=Petrolisthes manimaculis TaxID=1843537 RepID=A0AAE1UII7_9EUCA|nr:hypothetical protein Pmani_004420 [Petrolisthes manimaculis]
MQSGQGSFYAKRPQSSARIKLVTGSASPTLIVFLDRWLRTDACNIRGPQSNLVCLVWKSECSLAAGVGCALDSQAVRGGTGGRRRAGNKMKEVVYVVGARVCCPRVERGR